MGVERMSFLDLLAYIATALILVAYAKGKWLDQANAYLWPFIALSAISHRAFPSLAITLIFGLIGITKLVRAYRRRTWKGWPLGLATVNPPETPLNWGQRDRMPLK